MAANTYTTSDLISLIKLLGHVPQGNLTFTPANILTLADFELQTAISKQLKETDEGFFQTVVEYDQNDTGLYPVPGNAIASTAYAVQVRNGQAIWPVSRQEVAEMTTTTYPSTGNWTYFIRSNTFHLLPSQFGGGVLTITYDRRRSKLVPTTSCGQVSAINGQVVTVTSVPTSWVVGDSIDLQQSSPQFDYLGTVDITNISGTDITLTGDLTDLAVDDYLCLEGQSCIPQIPVEFHQLLAQRVVCKIYELQGYMDKLKAAKAILKEMEDALTALVTPRTQAAPKVINPSWGGRKPGSNWARFNPPASGHG
jgi:hypothetical protein